MSSLRMILSENQVPLFRIMLAAPYEPTRGFLSQPIYSDFVPDKALIVHNIRHRAEIVDNCGQFREGADDPVRP